MTCCRDAAGPDWGAKDVGAAASEAAAASAIAPASTAAATGAGAAAPFRAAAVSTTVESWLSVSAGACALS